MFLLDNYINYHAYGVDDMDPFKGQYQPGLDPHQTRAMQADKAGLVLGVT